MALIDDVILNRKLFGTLPGRDTELDKLAFKVIAQSLLEAQCFDYTEVLHIFAHHYKVRGFNFERDVSCARPPGNTIWLESTLDRHQLGVLLLSEQLPSPHLTEWLVPFGMLTGQGRKHVAKRFLVKTPAPQELVPVSNCILVSSSYFRHDHRLNKKVYEPHGAKVLTDEIGVPLTFEMLNKSNFEIAEREACAKAFSEWFSTAWWFLTLLQCKNVTAERVLRDDRLQKARIRKGKPALREFYVLNVTLPGQKSKATSGNVNSGGAPKRLHTVRGHLATYTAERPLFGKYAGTYWIPAMVRGQTEAGSIEKRYKAKTKRETLKTSETEAKGL